MAEGGEAPGAEVGGLVSGGHETGKDATIGSLPAGPGGRMPPAEEVEGSAGGDVGGDGGDG